MIMKLLHHRFFVTALITAAVVTIFAACQPVQNTPIEAVAPPTALPEPTSESSAIIAARSLIAEQLKVAPSTLVLLSDERVDWPDSCLGIARPEEICAAVITPGHKITLSAAGQEYEIHTDLDGTLVRISEALAQTMAGGGAAIEEIPVEESDVKLLLALVNLNIRNGPGTEYERVGRVEAGQRALVTGITADGGWWRVICPDDTVGNCFVVNDATYVQPIDEQAEQPVVTDSGEMTTYADPANGILFEHPANWQPDLEETGSRGYIKQFAAPDGSLIALTLQDWDPKGDLAAFVETRKTAWGASGMTILDEQAWTLADDHPALRFIIRSADGSEDAFFLITTLGERYLTLSGSGDLDILATVAKSLKLNTQ